MKATKKMPYQVKYEKLDKGETCFATMRQAKAFKIQIQKQGYKASIVTSILKGKRK